MAVRQRCTRTRVGVQRFLQREDGVGRAAGRERSWAPGSLPVPLSGAREEEVTSEQIGRERFGRVGAGFPCVVTGMLLYILSRGRGGVFVS